MQKKFEHAYREGAVYSPREPPGRLRAVPIWYFFYGTLMDPEFFASVAELEEQPNFVDAKVERCCLKYFGHFPVLCQGKEAIYGKAWYVPSAEIVERLREYESDAYRESAHYVKLKNGEEILARAFCWDRDEEDLLEEPLV